MGKFRFRLGFKSELCPPLSLDSFWSVELMQSLGPAHSRCTIDSRDSKDTVQAKVTATVSREVGIHSESSGDFDSH